MKKVHLNLKRVENRSYDILIDRGLLNVLGRELKKRKLGNKYLIITDSNVERLFGKTLLRQLRKHLDVSLISFKAGEQSKNLKTMEALLEKTSKAGLDRASAIIALGGGVVGDVAGYVAASYMRGINYIQVPTTLLAMVDSSIGGKVAVDLKSGKNMAGAFYQPKAVFIDISLLKSLPKKELLCGLAEIIKHSLIMDRKLFSFLTKNKNKILSKDEEILMELIKRNCEIKAKIVEKDEHEANIRKLVNYGHTLGHALETLTNYKRYSHGEAIVIGMAAASSIANRIGMLSKREKHMQNKLLIDYGFSIKVPNMSFSKIIKTMKKDKKATSGSIEFVLLRKIGKASFGIKVDEGIIKKSLEEFR